MMISYSIISVISASMTFNLIKIPGMTPTRASAGLSLVAIACFSIVNHFYLFAVQDISALFFGASFVGMCSHKIFNDYEIIFAAIIFGTLYSLFIPKLAGLGGALGFCAFVSIVTTYILFKSFYRGERSNISNLLKSWRSLWFWHK